MREFTTEDYMIYAGAEPFKGGEEPMIHTLECGMDIVADYNGVSLNGEVGTRSVAFILHECRHHTRMLGESAAKDWISELDGLKKHEIIALLTNIGIENLI